MKQKIFAIKDKAAGFIEIFMTESKYKALRSMTDAVNNPNPTTVSQHPGDFSLFELGEVETDDGVITPKTAFIEEFSALVNKKGK